MNNCISDTKKQEHIVVKKTGHLHQCDISVVLPLELYLKTDSYLFFDTVSTYFLMSHLWMDFLQKIGLGNRIEVDKVRAFIMKMEKEWIHHDVKYTPDQGPKS